MDELTSFIRESRFTIGEVRAIWLIHSPFGAGRIPAISTLRVLRSVTKRTKHRTKPVRVSSSTLKKSVAAIAPQCAFGNVSREIPFLRIGSNPFSSRIRFIVLRPISCPNVGRSLNSGGSPAWILTSHSEDQLPNFSCSSRMPRASALAAVILPRDQLTVPPEQSIRGHQGLYLEEPFTANLLGLRRESVALLIGKPKSLSTQLFAQGPLFLLEIFDQVLLVPIPPASEDQHQKLKRQSVHLPESRPPVLGEMG